MTMQPLTNNLHEINQNQHNHQTSQQKLSYKSPHLVDIELNYTIKSGGSTAA